MYYINAASRHDVSEERKVSFERADRMRAELESMDMRLEEERKRSAELLLQVTLSKKLATRHLLNYSIAFLLIMRPSQVNVLQKSLLSQNEEQRRIAALEQQVTPAHTRRNLYQIFIQWCVFASFEVSTRQMMGFTDCT